MLENYCQLKHIKTKKVAYFDIVTSLYMCNGAELVLTQYPGKSHFGPKVISLKVVLV